MLSFQSMHLELLFRAERSLGVSSSKARPVTCTVEMRSLSCHGFSILTADVSRLSIRYRQRREVLTFPQQIKDSLASTQNVVLPRKKEELCQRPRSANRATFKRILPIFRQRSRKQQKLHHTIAYYRAHCSLSQSLPRYHPPPKLRMVTSTRAASED